MSKKSKGYYKSFFFFYFSIGIELMFLPVLYLREYLLKMYSLNLNRSGSQCRRIKFRNEVVDENLLNVCVHEWGGYELTRSKTIRGRRFNCGLQYQLDRLNDYQGPIKLKKTITISDYHIYKHADKLTGFDIIPVENLAMDFSGYSKFIELLPNDNQYVLLMNSSLSDVQVEFIDQYLQYFSKNKEIGMLGISFSSKSYQTLVKNNFKPHIQSFFILTTKKVLEEVIQLNGGFLPGSKSAYKLSIIKYGELRISEAVLKLGYKIAVVKENGRPLIFYRDKWYDNGYGRWNTPEGDCRLYVKHLNTINSLLAED